MSDTPPIRVVLTDDSSFARSLLRSLLEDAGGFEVVAEATNGQEAVELARTLRPNLVTMDLEMPVMGGLAAIEEIMCSKAVPILVVSAVADAQAAYAAVAKGAVDVVNKPGLEPGECEEFIQKARMTASIPVITHVRALRVPLFPHARDSERPPERPLERPPTASPSPLSPPPVAPPLAPSAALGWAAASSAPIPLATEPPRTPFALPPLPPLVSDRRRVIAIASSTGGPQALAHILGHLSADFPLPIVIAQHISDGFAAGMADWLNGLSPLQVSLAREGEVPVGGRVYLSPSEAHLTIQRSYRFHLLPRESRDLYRPSCDHLLSSVADVYRSCAIGVILTGMGHDGAKGLSAVREAGGTTLAQNETTSIIYGMNRVAIEAGAAQYILPLEDIAQTLTRLAQKETNLPPTAQGLGALI